MAGILIVYVVSASQEKLDKPPSLSQAVQYLATTILPAWVGVLGFWAAYRWFQERRAQCTRQLNKLSTSEAIELILALPPGESKSTVAELLWMRTAYNDDLKARAYLMGENWQNTPSSGPSDLDRLRASVQARQRKITPLTKLALWVVVAICLVCMPASELVRIGFWTTSSPLEKELLVIGSKAWSGILFWWMTAGPHTADSTPVTADLIDRWINGSPSAHYGLKRQARSSPVAYGIAERCGWEVRRFWQ